MQEQSDVVMARVKKAFITEKGNFQFQEKRFEFLMKSQQANMEKSIENKLRQSYEKEINDLKNKNYELSMELEE